MTEADDAAHAAKTIDALVEALEKIEAKPCAAAVDYSGPRYEGDARFVCLRMGYTPCVTCIAFEALTLFRGQ